jgi:hypothetical protein
LTNGTNSTSFLDKDHVSLSMDMEAVGSPDEYNVMFFTIESFRNETGNYDAVDFTDWLSVPKPEIVISKTPSSLVMKPGEESFVTIRANATKAMRNYNYEMSLSIEKQEENRKDGLELSFLDPHDSTLNRDYSDLFLFAIGTTATPSNDTAILKVKALGDVIVRPYVIGMFLDITYKLPSFGPEIFLPYINEKAILNPNINYNYSNNVLYSTPVELSESGLDSALSSLPITVKPYSATEFLNDIRGNLLSIWTENKEFLTVPGVALVGAWILNKIRKKQKNNKHE